MTYNVFNGTLNPAQSQSQTHRSTHCAYPGWINLSGWLHTWVVFGFLPKDGNLSQYYPEHRVHPPSLK